ncbi:hypothetical protein ACHAW5_010348 [Stephanodiscus triporus]|uniref:Uncharacterized protein n=1 Tax=Stephanodiscus triporus TaxID=2934178 RepID=A0ABD3NTJ5_9STRA
MDQNHADVWGAFVKALKTVRYVSGGADEAAHEEESDYYATTQVTFDDEEQEEEQEENNGRPIYDFILPSQESSSSSEESHLTQAEIDDLLSTHADVVQSIESSNNVPKLGFFDPDPFSDCEYIGSAPSGGFPFGGRKTKKKTATAATAAAFAMTADVGTQAAAAAATTDVGTQATAAVAAATATIGTQTVAAKSRSFGTQTTPVSTPDAPRRPVRERRPPSSLKEYDYYFD